MYYSDSWDGAVLEFEGKLQRIGAILAFQGKPLRMTNTENNDFSTAFHTVFEVLEIQYIILIQSM